MASLRKIVLDPKWLNPIHFYVKFRHTSELESYNSIMTEGMAFENTFFIMRVMLATMDHNFHLFRNPQSSSDGRQLGHHKYSKRSQKCYAELIREEKSYS